MILESNIQMKTVLQLYYLHHSFDSFTDFMIFFMVYLGNLALQGLNSNQLNTSVDEMRSSLVLCANCLKSYGKVFHVSKLAYFALSKRMSPNDLRLLRTYSNPEDNAMDKQTLINHAHRYAFGDTRHHCHFILFFPCFYDLKNASSWPIPVSNVKNEDPEKARLKCLIEPKTESSLEDDSSVTSSPEQEHLWINLCIMTQKIDSDPCIEK